MTDLSHTTVQGITQLAGLELDRIRIGALAAAATPTLQMIRKMTDSADLGETPPANPFNAGWE